MKKIATALALASAAMAAQAVPFVIEGSAKAMRVMARNGLLGLGDPTRIEVDCGNVTVQVVAGRTVVVTPVGEITLAQLVNTTPFIASGFDSMTGRPRQGFTGGGCIAVGDTATSPGNLIVDTLEIDVQESVFVGTVGGVRPLRTTRVGTAPGMEVVTILDPRLSAIRPSSGFWNANGTHPAGRTPTTQGPWTMTVTDGAGFGANPDAAVVGDVLSVDGYFGTDGKMYGHTISVGDAPLTRTDPRPAIARFRCTVKGGGQDDVDIRGGCVMPAQATTTNVTIEYPDAQGVMRVAGTAACTRVAPAVGTPARGYEIGLWRLPTTNLDFGGACPAGFRASTTQGGVTRYDWSFNGRVR